MNHFKKNSAIYILILFIAGLLTFTTLAEQGRQAENEEQIKACVSPKLINVSAGRHRMFYHYSYADGKILNSFRQLD